MCGIVGVVHPGPRPPCTDAELIAMRDALVHRGPDDEGILQDPGVSLGSRRLAILDLSPRGRMPMRTPDRRYSIVYNGEVYNCRELRETLRSRGWEFQSSTDTEVVLYLFAEHGPAMLEQLNGMFAIAIWDHRDRTLFLARDRLGVKPLYYTLDGPSLRFASEPKALFAVGRAPRFDPDHWEELLCFRYVAGEQTPYAGVRRLLAGHYLLWHEGATRIQRWWNLGARAREFRDAERAAIWFRETFDDAVALRRISDVPVGVLLSGGLDSGSVAASLALDAGPGVESFTVGFAERGYDEREKARQVAGRWSLKAHELEVTPEGLAGQLLDALWLNDEPFAHGHEAHIWAIAKYAKPRVSVLLSGEGADETLGGYARYRPLQYPAAARLAGSVTGWAGALFPAAGPFRKLVQMLSLPSSDAMVLFNACDVLPSDLSKLGFPAEGTFPYRNSILEEAKAAYPDSRIRQAMYLDQHAFLSSLLDRNDKMTMGASIECRVPFLDYRLVEGLAALPTKVLLPTGPTKALLRRATGDRLPPTILRGAKWGFGVPWDRYFRQVPELRATVADLPKMKPIVDGPFDRRPLEELVHRYLQGDRRSDALVRQLALIALWHKACVENQRPVRAAS